MKKMIVILVCLGVLLLAAGCAEEPYVPETTQETAPETMEKTPVIKGSSLKLLAITSSFGLNTTQFLYDIAEAEGFEEVVVARLYIGGCTLATHVQNARTDAYAYQYTKNSSGVWDTVNDVNLKYGLQDEQWDVIFLQHSAAGSGQVETYGNHIDTLTGYVNEHKSNPDAALVWNMTWAYQADSDQTVFHNRFGANQQLMYEKIVEAVQLKVVPREDFAAIIPTGTAIQNARTGHFGDHLTKDGYHLNNMGRAIAGYTLFATLTGEPLTEIHLGTVKSYDIAGVLELSVEDRRGIAAAVNAALETPFSVTPMKNTEA